MAKRSKGAAQYKNTKGRHRQDNLARYYAHRWPELRLDEQEFRFTLLRTGSKALPRLSLDSVVESCEWLDEDLLLSGTLQLRKPHADEGRLPISMGHLVRCEVRWFGSWVELWRMRVDKPVTSLEDGSMQIELVDRLAWFARSEDHFTYRRNKRKKPKGWLCHEIAAHVCRRYGIRIGKLAQGTKRIRKLEMSGSPLDVIKRVYGIERRWSGRRYVIRFVQGRLNIMPLRRNPVIYTLGPHLTGGTIERSMSSQFATVLEVRSTRKKGKRKREPIKHVETRRDLVKRYGYIRRRKTMSGLDSHAEARTRAKREIAKHSYPKRVVSIEHPGISVLRRGDAAQLQIPEEGFTGRRSYVFCRSVRHSVTAGSYMMSVDFSVEDPFKNLRQEREDALKRQKRRKRG